jgi:hypothetical protein
MVAPLDTRKGRASQAGLHMATPECAIFACCGGLDENFRLSPEGGPNWAIATPCPQPTPDQS